MSRRLLVLFCFMIISTACTPEPPDALPTLVSLDELATQQAPSLFFWEAQNGALSAAATGNDYRFSARAGDEIRLRVIRRSGVPVTMTLVDSGGAIIGTGDTIETMIQRTGDYLVRVTTAEAGASAYQIGLSYTDRENPANNPTLPPQVVGIPTPTPVPYVGVGTFVSELRAGEIFSDTLSDTIREHVYTFDGETGQVIGLELRRVNGDIDPFLTLYAPDGRPLAMDDDTLAGGNARIQNVALPDAGLYSVQVTGGAGTYELVLTQGYATLSIATPDVIPSATVAPYATPTLGFVDSDSALTDHQPVIGNIVRGGDFARFSFSVRAGDSATIMLMPYGTSGIRPRFELFDPAGALVTTASGRDSNANGAAFRPAIPLAEGGTYTLIVTGEDGSTGTYMLTYGRGVTMIDEVQPAPPSSERLNATIDRRGERHAWRVTLNAGDVITVAATGDSESQLDPYLEIATSDGVVLFADDNAGGNRNALIRVATITETGAYSLRVRDASGNATGDYTLVWRYINLAPSPTPPPATAPLMRISDTVEMGSYQFYVFQGLANQRVRIRVNADNSEIDPVAVLIAPDGEEIAMGDDSDGSLNADFIATLPANGTYTIRVNGYLSGGAFEVLLDLML